MDLLEFAALMQAGGILAGIAIALLELRDFGKTRKADLLMELYAISRSKEFNRDYMEILKHGWKDVDNWMEIQEGRPIAKNIEAYSKWLSVALYFEGVGVLLYRRLIDISLVDDLLSSEILILWEHIEPAVKKVRADMNRPQLFEYFEYLYEQMKRRERKLSSHQK